MSTPWKLMVLEDDTQLREVLATVLEDEGYEVVAVANGSAAVELAAREAFDLIITDIRMDGMNGLDALEQARRLQPQLHSLVVSGYTTEAETLRALQLNVGGFLKKPFSLGDLLQRVRELLSQRQLELQESQGRERLRHSLWWVLEKALARDGSDAGALAFHLALESGSPAGEAYAARLAAMLLASHWSELPSFAGGDALGLGPIHALLQELRKGEPSLSGQAVAAALQLVEGTPPAPLHPRLAAVLAQDPELSADSPRVQASLAVQEQALGLTPSTRVHRRLLGLGQTLEERGDWAAAQEAYARLREDPEAAPETRAQALIGTARALFCQGPPSHGAAQDGEYYELLKEAELQSRALGPLAGATLRQLIASLLLRSRHPSCEAYLSRLEEECEQLGLGVAWARARLARATLSGGDERLEEAVRLLSSAAHLGEVTSESAWLAPALLFLGARAGLEKGPWACRIAREFPAAVGRWALAEPTGSAGLNLLFASMESHPELVVSSFLDELAAHPQLSARVAALRPRLDEKEPAVSVRIRSFGTFELHVNGRSAPDSMWKSQKYKFLLAFLVARPGQTVPEEVVVEEFWSGNTSAKASLYSATTTIRRCLREGGVENAADCLRRDADGLTFDPPPSCWHDLSEFEKALASFSESGNLEAGRQAASLLGGPYLQGCYLDWALRQRSRLDEASIRLFAQLGEALRESRPQEALDYAQRGLELDPTAQECHLVRMQAFLKLGQPEKAMRQFSTCQQVLRKELDIEPLTSLYELYYRAQLAQP